MMETETFVCRKRHRARATFLEHTGKARTDSQIVGPNTRATVVERGAKGLVTLSPAADPSARLTLAWIVFSECWEPAA